MSGVHCGTVLAWSQARIYGGAWGGQAPSLVMMCPLSPQGASQKLKWVSICFRSGDISILRCQVVSWVWPLPVIGFTRGRSRLKARTQISGGRHWFHVSRTFLSGSITRWTSLVYIENSLAIFQGCYDSIYIFLGIVLYLLAVMLKGNFSHSQVDFKKLVTRKML